ncbi:hypothetical protein ONE63_011150 [Megalurothrips usitatus]|uniref:Uncharacterized protein n=1 Tax=Megalurothrips usitatus TaxID=439358 RepID=A0AAV7XF68_9NEOP|nr:hypothetical protein ONE63_011150 [Megalurothrips usitatus]
MERPTNASPVEAGGCGGGLGTKRKLVTQQQGTPAKMLGLGQRAVARRILPTAAAMRTPLREANQQAGVTQSVKHGEVRQLQATQERRPVRVSNETKQGRYYRRLSRARRAAENAMRISPVKDAPRERVPSPPLWSDVVQRHRAPTAWGLGGGEDVQPPEDMTQDVHSVVGGSPLAGEDVQFAGPAEDMTQDVYSVVGGCSLAGEDVEFAGPAADMTQGVPSPLDDDRPPAGLSYPTDYDLSLVAEYVNVEPREGMREALRRWSLAEFISRAAVDRLLSVLRPFEPSLPKDARTLWGLHRIEKPVVHVVGSGKYVHFGLERRLVNLLKGVADVRPNVFTNLNGKVSLFLNFDGAAPYNSGKSSFWPILASVRELNGICDNVVMAGCYYGQKKPPLEPYLQRFQAELLSIQASGVTVCDTHLSVVLSGIVCDSVALAHMKGIKGHGAFEGCPRCKVHGVRVDGATCFFRMDAAARTDGQFRARSSPGHHNEVTPLVNVPGLDLIRDFPVDAMHVCFLRVVRSLPSKWRAGRREYVMERTATGGKKWELLMRGSRRVPATNQMPLAKLLAIDRLLIRFRTMWPSEFQRRLREITDAESWKAVEARMLAVYVAPFLKEFMSPRHYRHLLSIHCAVRLLSAEDVQARPDDIDLAECLIRDFVRRGDILFGKGWRVFAVHNLLHMVDDVRRFGALDSYSAWPFENFQRKVRSMVKGAREPLSQLHYALRVRDSVPHSKPEPRVRLGPELKAGNSFGLEGVCHKYVVVDGHKFSCVNNFDRNATLNDGSTLHIESIVDLGGDDVFIAGHRSMFCVFEFEQDKALQTLPWSWVECEKVKGLKISINSAHPTPRRKGLYTVWLPSGTAGRGTVKDLAMQAVQPVKVGDAPWKLYTARIVSENSMTFSQAERLIEGILEERVRVSSDDASRDEEGERVREGLTAAPLDPAAEVCEDPAHSSGGGRQEVEESRQEVEESRQEVEESRQEVEESGQETRAEEDRIRENREEAEEQGCNDVAPDSQGTGWHRVEKWMERVERRMEAMESRLQIVMGSMQQVLSAQTDSVKALLNSFRRVTANETAQREELSRALGMEVPVDTSNDLADLEQRLMMDDNLVTVIAEAAGSHGAATLKMLCEKVSDLVMTKRQQRRLNATGSMFTEKEKELGIPEMDDDVGAPATHKLRLEQFPSVMSIYVKAAMHNKATAELRPSIREIIIARNVAFNRAAQRHEEVERLGEGLPKRAKVIKPPARRPTLQWGRANLNASL